jgi:rhodanese-related sulfurtransferase
MKTLAFCLLMLALTGCKTATVATTDSGVPVSDLPAREVSPSEAQEAVSKAYSQFIDVRSPEEYSGGHAARSVNIPLDTLKENLDRLEKTEPVYVICESGGRSQKAAGILKDNGFGNVLSVKGGTVAWRQAGLPIDTRPPHGSNANLPN